MPNRTFEDCYCRWDQRELVIGNDGIERAYDLSGGVIRATGLLDKALGRQWLAADPGRVLFRLPGMEEGGAFEGLEIDCGTDDNHGLSKEFLWVSLGMSFPHCTVETRLRIHPGVPAVSMSHFVCGQPREEDWEEYPPRDFRHGRREASDMKEAEWPRPDTIEALRLPPGHLRARAVRFYDVTDVYNTLAREEECLLYGGRGYEKLQGNLLFLSDDVEPGGLLIVKEAPTLVGQLNYRGCDFHTAAREVLEVRGTGLKTAELQPERPLACYGSTVAVYDPHTESGEETLRAWYNAWDRPLPDRHTYILANTWGNRSQDEKVCAEFIQAEIDRAAEMGVDVCQIDYGWQYGSIFDPATHDGFTSDRYRDREDAFWGIREDRFPEQFEHITEHGREKGVEVGVWFAPDDWNDFADWELDRDRLLDLYRRFDMRHFKLDIFDVSSKLGEARLADMLDGLMEGSDGQIALQMDLTNCRRLGYFYHHHIGEIFLENRYTDWGNYYPHYTLRNLWQLSRYIPTRRLEMEFLDLDRNPGNYPDDPLAPHHYSPAYAFAVTMAGSPLAWMELSELDEGEVTELSEVISAYRSERKRLGACDIWPIGEEPTGRSWTGFQAVDEAGGGYLLLYRELNDRPSATICLRGIRDRRLDLEVCCGESFDSDGRVDGDGRLTVSLAEARSFALVRYAPCD